MDHAPDAASLPIGELVQNVLLAIDNDHSIPSGVAPAAVELTQHISDVVAAHIDSHGISDSEYASIHLDVLHEMIGDHHSTYDFATTSGPSSLEAGVQPESLSHDPIINSHGGDFGGDFQHSVDASLQIHDNHEIGAYDFGHTPV